MELQERYFDIAKSFIEQYKKDKNIIGITLNGGVSRGTGDIYSEIDIYFYLKNKNKSTLPPRIKGIGGDIAVNEVWFEFKVFEFEKEKEREWDLVSRWDANNCKILFERERRISNLLKEKVIFQLGEKNKLLNEFGFKANWCIQLAEVFEYRKDIKHAHLMINESLGALVDYYFILNGQFVPHYKWKYYYFSKLKKPDFKVKNLIFDLFIIREYSKVELYRRINTIKKEIFVKNLKMEEDHPHKQNLEKVDNFISSLKDGILFSNPFGDDYTLAPKKRKK